MTARMHKGSTIEFRAARAVFSRWGLAIALALFPAVCGAQTGGLPGGTPSIAYGVSGNGLTVVGAITTQSNGQVEAVLWNLPNAEAVQTLGILSGGSGSTAYGTNYGSNTTSGSVVVGESTATNFNSGEAFIWTTAAVMEGLGVLSGGLFSAAYAVNANSTSTLNAIVVGQSGSSAVGLGEAFIWQSGSMKALGVLSGYQSSTAFGLSADGSVVVGYSRASSGGASEAFRWTQTTGMVGLGFLTGGTSCGQLNGGQVYNQAQATNSDGSVIVGTACSTAYRAGQAFRWSCTTSSCTGGTIVGLGTLPGGTWSAAYAVSSDGSVVAGYSNSTASPNSAQAFIWTASTGMQLFSATALAGWNLAAFGMSADGTIIAGPGANPSGAIQAWVPTVTAVARQATSPTPTTSMATARATSCGSTPAAM